MSNFKDNFVEWIALTAGFSLLIFPIFAFFAGFISYVEQVILWALGVLLIQSIDTDPVSMEEIESVIDSKTEGEEVRLEVIEK